MGRCIKEIDWEQTADAEIQCRRDLFCVPTEGLKAL